MENINIGNSGWTQRKIFIEKCACPKMGRKGPECALKWGWMCPKMRGVY